MNHSWGGSSPSGRGSFAYGLFSLKVFRSIIRSQWNSFLTLGPSTESSRYCCQLFAWTCSWKCLAGLLIDVFTFDFKPLANGQSILFCRNSRCRDLAVRSDPFWLSFKTFLLDILTIYLWDLSIEKSWSLILLKILVVILKFNSISS